MYKLPEVGKYYEIANSGNIRKCVYLHEDIAILKLVKLGDGQDAKDVQPLVLYDYTKAVYTKVKEVPAPKVVTTMYGVVKKDKDGRFSTPLLFLYSDEKTRDAFLNDIIIGSSGNTRTTAIPATITFETDM